LLEAVAAQPALAVVPLRMQLPGGVLDQLNGAGAKLRPK
jgi:hypothetical protein